MGRDIIFDDQPNPPNPIPEPNPTPEPEPNPIPELPDPPPAPEPSPDEPSPGQPADKVNPQIIDALTIGTVNTIAASPSFALANLYQHQVNHARRLDSMTEACLGKMLERMSSEDPVEALAIGKLFQAEADSSINSLLAQLDAGQIGAKIAQSTAGDLSTEIAKIGASIASVQGLIGGLVGLLQQMLIGGTGGVGMAPAVLSKRKDEYDIPNPPPIPEEDRPPTGKYPVVTIRY